MRYSKTENNASCKILLLEMKMIPPNLVVLCRGDIIRADTAYEDDTKSNARYNVHYVRE